MIDCLIVNNIRNPHALSKIYMHSGAHVCLLFWALLQTMTPVSLKHFHFTKQQKKTKKEKEKEGIMFKFFYILTVPGRDTGKQDDTGRNTSTCTGKEQVWKTGYLCVFSVRNEYLLVM